MGYRVLLISVSGRDAEPVHIEYGAVVVTTGFHSEARISRTAKLTGYATDTCTVVQIGSGKLARSVLRRAGWRSQLALSCWENEPSRGTIEHLA